MFDKIKKFFNNCYQILCSKGELAPEKYVTSFIIILLILTVFAVAAVLVVDPYMRYHKEIGLKHRYRKSEAMIPGIMRNFDYDTVLFGSSMTQNFDIAEMNAILGGRCIKATGAGLESESLDKNAIISAIKNGKFYASQGPEVHAYKKGDEIVVKCSPCSEIAFLSDWVWSERMFVGENLTEARYKPVAQESYVRVQVKDKEGKLAWTNCIKI